MKCFIEREDQGCIGAVQDGHDDNPTSEEEAPGGDEGKAKDGAVVTGGTQRSGFCDEWARLGVVGAQFLLWEFWFDRISC